MSDAVNESRRGRRGVGQRAGLQVHQIVAAARALPYQDLTMQAVADRLGVDRKALHHHVHGREALIALVARDAFAGEFDATGIAEADSWDAACWVYALAFIDGLRAIGQFATAFAPETLPLAGIIAPTEALLGKLADAGFEDEHAAQTVMLLTFLCTGYAQTALLTERAGEHLGLVQLRDALSRSPCTDVRRVRRMAARDIDTSGPRMFARAMDVFVGGCQRQLDLALSTAQG